MPIYSNEVSRYKGVKRECYDNWQIHFTWDGMTDIFASTTLLGCHPKKDPLENLRLYSTYGKLGGSTNHADSPATLFGLWVTDSLWP